MAIAVVLLGGAMLLMRSFLALHRVQPGFDPRNLLTLKAVLAGPEDFHAGPVDRLAYQIAEPVERIPGVDRATVASSLPTQGIVDMILDIPGRPPLEGFKFTGDVLWCAVSSSYFDTLRIPLRSGRLFREQEPPHTVIINEAMRRKFWPNQNTVGQSILIGAGLGPELDQGSTEIVGVVGDVHDRLDIDPPATTCSPVAIATTCPRGNDKQLLPQQAGHSLPSARNRAEVLPPSCLPICRHGQTCHAPHPQTGKHRNTNERP
jgi:hypothetical protein